MSTFFFILILILIGVFFIGALIFGWKSGSKSTIENNDELLDTMIALDMFDTKKH